MKRITIYGLEDPRNGIIRYVGQTEDVYVRFIAHLRAEKSDNPKDAWIQELRVLNLMVIMRTLEVVDSSEAARDREAYWIQHYLYLALKVNVFFFNKHLPANVVEIPPEMAHQAKVKKIWQMRDAGKNQTEIIETIWGVSRGGSAAYAKARDEYLAIMGRIVLEDVQEG